MQMGDASYISVSVFVINHDMLNSYVWSQKLNINRSGFIKTESISKTCTKVKWRLLRVFCLVLITYLDILGISELFRKEFKVTSKTSCDYVIHIFT